MRAAASTTHLCIQIVQEVHRVTIVGAPAVGMACLVLLLNGDPRDLRAEHVLLNTEQQQQTQRQMIPIPHANRCLEGSDGTKMPPGDSVVIKAQQGWRESPGQDSSSKT